MANRSATHSWDVAEAEKRYLSNRELSYANIAEEFSVSLSAVKRYATSREWPKRRQNATENGLNQHQQGLEDHIASINEEHRLIARNIITIGNRALLRLNRVLEQGRDINAQELSSLASALHKAIMLERVIVGLPIIIARSEPREIEQNKLRDPEEVEETMQTLLARGRRLARMQAGIDPNLKKP